MQFSDIFQYLLFNFIQFFKNSCYYQRKKSQSRWLVKETYLFILLRKECVIIINDEISNAHLILFAIIRWLGKRSIQICFLVLSKSIYEYKLFINLPVMYIFSVCYLLVSTDRRWIFILHSLVFVRHRQTQRVWREIQVHTTIVLMFTGQFSFFFLLLPDKNCILP